MNTKIGLAQVADAEVLAELSRTLIEHGLPWTWTEDRIRHQIRHPECAVIVARDRRRLAGFASMQYLDEHAHLNLLAVRPGYRRHGIGRALVSWLEACARTAGIFDVRLELRVSNDAALRFYARLGYSETGICPNYYGGREDARRMAHDLRMLPASSP
jgi:ribosomal-protein-alanine N-acetyltransferase